MAFPDLFAGFLAVLTPHHLLFALLGCIMGMLVGVLPGFGPAAAVSLLIPVTFGLDATTALITLSAILYGAAYGGTTTAVLLNIPGEASSVATAIDGYQMAKQGRGGPALVMAAVASFVGGTIAVVGFVLVAPFSRLALEFGPPELFAVALLGMTLMTSFVGSSIPKALLSAAAGLAIATVGLDPGTGTERFTGGLPQLFDGIGLVAVVMGCFGLAELLSHAQVGPHGIPRLLSVNRLLPTRDDVRRSGAPILRGSVIGFFMGLLPGSPGAATSLASYAAEKGVSKSPERFGKGAIEGVAGPEAANNALAVSSLIPLFTLGIPTSATVAIMASAFTVNGLIPGPLLFRDNPDVAWTIIASLLVGNFILLVLNVPFARVWIQLLKTPFAYLTIAILAFMFIGSYSINGDVFDIYVLVAAGVLGYLFRLVDIPLTPLVLALILGPMLEDNFQRALSLSQGDFSILYTGPINITLLIASVVAVLASVVRPAVTRRLARRWDASPAPTQDQVPPTDTDHVDPTDEPSTTTPTTPPSSADSNTAASGTHPTKKQGPS
jgi:putative tricarboxylic transport membrane protein